MIRLLWGPPAAFELYRVPTFLASFLNVFEDPAEQWSQFKTLRSSISHLRSQEVIAAAGGRQHLEGSVQENWWPIEDARERTLTSKVEVALRKALGELKIDMNVEILTPTRATTLVYTIVRLVQARIKRIKRKFGKDLGEEKRPRKISRIGKKSTI